jgi:hypothetical protein
MGTQTCVGEEFGAWGPCQNGIRPSVEVCDGLDNDCNGCDDDGLCCDAQINCPRSADVPAAHPFQPYRFDGTQWYSGQATSWSWTVEGGHCDELLGNQFTITGADTATPELMFTLSGDYAVTLEVVGPTGTHVCNFVLHVAGPGLRVELCWEGTGSRDVDLHLLRHDLNADWCDTRNDCYYMNCAGADYDVNWGYPRSPLTHCQNGPEGDDWADLGYCANPRLDIDNIYTEGIPENINLDNPNDGDQFRTMVHYYNGSGEAYPLVNIYCDGHRVATYGQAPNRVTGFTDSEHGCQGHTWRVADIQTHLSGGETSCTVTALHHRNETSGYLIRRNNNQFD